ncbi:MAG: CinA family protein [Bacteriovoracaceae bacterium]|nr:CinA family protein [Bacteriovoracaceae bacterium]
MYLDQSNYSGQLVDIAYSAHIPLPEYVIDLCSQNNLTIGFAESATGGLISSMITDIAGSSQVFNGSIVCYSNALKHDLLGVSYPLIEKYGVVSVEVAKAMALGVKKCLDVDIALSVTGLAGPGGPGSYGQPVGSVSIGWALNDGRNRADSFCFNGKRLELKKQFCTTVFLKAIELLIGYNG